MCLCGVTIAYLKVRGEEGPGVDRHQAIHTDSMSVSSRARTCSAVSLNSSPERRTGEASASSAKNGNGFQKRPQNGESLSLTLFPRMDYTWRKERQA